MYTGRRCYIYGTRLIFFFASRIRNLDRTNLFTIFRIQTDFDSGVFAI